MKQTYFRPWQGSNYRRYRTLILSESTYDWSVDNSWFSPKPDHPSRSVEQAINQIANPQYFTRLTRAICKKEHPSIRDRRVAWNNFAYTVYLQQSVGRGAGTRPTRDLWEESKRIFPAQFSTLHPQPRKLIITGKDMWNRMPDCDRELIPDIQAYRINGELIWCLALPHPANRADGQGFAWQNVGEYINTFLETTFPSK